MNTRCIWNSKNVPLPALDYGHVEQWLDAVASAHGKRLGNMSYIFCDDPEILSVNRQFLQHDYFTDIITFDYCIGKLLRGDMYISLDTVETNAVAVSQPYGCELLRVIVHGLLHLCGIDDKAPGAREIMEGHEEKALQMYAQMFPEDHTPSVVERNLIVNQ